MGIFFARTMATAAPRPCTAGGCRALSHDGTGRCPAHPRISWAKETIRPVQRISGRRLQVLRDKLFSERPLCEVCEREGRARRATIRDHIIPLAEGGTDENDNIQAICAQCHDIKTHSEAKRGRGRAAQKSN